jgi:tetratricopeptide (TPR) repeat protein
VETTDSEAGLTTLNNNVKEDFVENLARGKMISEEEKINSSIASIFQQYALEESQIDEYELASYQYSNRGLVKLSNLDYEGAFSDFEKAFFLKPSIELAAILLQTGGVVLHMSDYSDLSHVVMLGKLSRFSEFGITEDDVMYEFERITEKTYHDRSDLEKYEDAFMTLSAMLENELLLKKISYSYYREIIESLLNEKDLGGTVPYLYELYKLDTTASESKKMIRDLIINEINQSISPPPEQLTLLDQYRSEFSEVFEMPLMNLFELHLMVRSAEYWFDQGKPELGNQQLDQFEKNVEGNGEINKIALDIQSAYVTAAYYYYNQGNVRKTREYLKRGLSVIPDSYKLKNLQRSI